jgi:hypothetical protein
MFIGAVEHFELSDEEIAVMCSSHKPPSRTTSTTTALGNMHCRGLGVIYIYIYIYICKIPPRASSREGQYLDLSHRSGAGVDARRGVRCVRAASSCSACGTGVHVDKCNALNHAMNARCCCCTDAMLLY